MKMTIDPIYKGDDLELDTSQYQWDEDALLKVVTKKITSINLPEQDFAQTKFDSTYYDELKTIFFLISTPRSGSTAMCDSLYNQTGMVVHEYFQPFQYMPVLAERWRCIKEGKIDPASYINELIRNRTNEKGVLGINLHGSHLNIYDFFKKYIGCGGQKIALYLKRKDKLAQAVSYYIAAHTKKWSSHFLDGKQEPKYSFSSIQEKLINILNQEKRIEFFLASECNINQTIYYENLINEGESLSEPLKNALKIDSLSLGFAQTKKQSNGLSTLFVERFLRDLIIRAKVLK